MDGEKRQTGPQIGYRMLGPAMATAGKLGGALSRVLDTEAAAGRRTFQPTLLSTIQAQVGQRGISVIGTWLFRLNFEVHGLEHVPRGEPVIVAAAPHRNWIDSFLIIVAMPPLPRVYFLGSAEGMFNTWWKRAVLRIMGGVVPVSMRSPSNRQALETSLAILAGGNSLGIFPEGWNPTNESPTDVVPLQRGVAFLSQRSGRRVLPVALAGSKELWRGRTLRIVVGPPLDPLAPRAGRDDQQAYVDQIRAAIRAVLPPLPPDVAPDQRQWPWLTQLLD